MDDNKKLLANEAYIQFGKWLNDQPFWLQDAAWRMYTGEKIDDEQIKIYAEMCIDQAAGKRLQYNHLDIGDIDPLNSGSKISILSLSEVKGVNALADNVHLEFSEEGITVIYGLNGAGKSGFMRIFKELSSCPYEEPIQPNVFKRSNSVPPSCRVVILQDGEQKDELCNLQGKSDTSPLSVCDVFDTRISNAYVTATNTVSYQPFVFTVLAEFAQIANRISHYIDILKDTVPQKNVRLPDELATDEYLRWVTEINKNTVIPSECLDWDQEREKKFAELLQLLDNEKVKKEIELADISKRTIQPVLDDLRTALAKYNREGLDSKYQKLVSTKKKYIAAQKLFSESADEQDRISIDSEDWKALWTTAKTYYESILSAQNGQHFGEIGSICPLCHQTISGEVQKRFSNINEYINGSCYKEYQEAEKDFKNASSWVIERTVTVDVVLTSLSGFLSEEKLTLIVSIYNAFQDLKTIQDVEKTYNTICGMQLNHAFDIVNELMNSFSTRIEELSAILNDDGKIKLKTQLEKLRCQKWVYDNKETIQQVISNLYRISELDNAKQYLKTNKITTESNKLAEALITQAYIDRFTRELFLMAPNIKVKLEKAPSRKGNSPYKVSLDVEDGKKYKLEDILSEGEQRIIALAAFFADATGREERTPIIIDDPISSLDLNYEESATKRIVEIAKSRQVIVFTHRISLLVGMSEVCKAKGVPMNEIHIRSTARGKGLPDFKDLYHGKLGAQLNGLKERVHEAKKKDIDSEEYADCIGRICQQFRICVERSVEDVLLLGMVRRFDRRIMTNNKVMKLTAITEEDCKIIDDMMGKYSFSEHSQPADSLVLQYSIDEIEQDISSFSQWIAQYNKRQK